MTEQEELKKLEEKKQKIELKYAKKAKKRLTEINKIISPAKAIVDMNDDELKNLLNVLALEVNFYNNHYQEYQRAKRQQQQRQQQQNNNQR